MSERPRPDLARGHALPPSGPQTAEPGLQDLLRDLWRARVWVIVFAALGLAAAVVFVQAATPYYRAVMIVTPANPMNGAEVSSLLASDDLFALRYMVQRVGVMNASDFTRFENVYSGVSVAAELLQDPRVQNGLTQDRPFAFSAAPSLQTAEALSEYIQRRVTAETIGPTLMRRLVYMHPDPAFAAYFLGSLHAVADGMIRQSINQDANERIAYLQGVISHTDHPEHRRALTALLLEQERLRMLVSIDQPYAAAVVEPPSSSSRPLWPPRALVLLCAAFAGGLAGFGFFVFARAPQAAVPRPRSGA